MSTRAAADLASQLEAMQQQLAALELDNKTKGDELALLRSRATLEEDSRPLEEEEETPPANNRQVSLHAGRTGPILTTTLRQPNIDKFSGDREKAADFVLAINGRLKATNQMDTFAGLEFAVGHFQGWAATWYRTWSQDHEVSSWKELRAHFEKAFKLVEETRVFEQRLMACKHTGDLTDYCEEFLRLASRLTELPDGFLQRTFARNSNSYLRDKLADRDFPTLLEAIHYVMGLIPKVEAHNLLPDSSGTPLMAAMPAGRSGAKRFEGICYNCNQTGHKAADCFKKPKAEGNAARGKVRFGQYKGNGSTKKKSGRMHAVEAVPEEDMSDDELRQGNDQA